MGTGRAAGDSGGRLKVPSSVHKLFRGVASNPRAASTAARLSNSGQVRTRKSDMGRSAPWISSNVRGSGGHDPVIFEVQFVVCRTIADADSKSRGEALGQPFSSAIRHFAEELERTFAVHPRADMAPPTGCVLEPAPVLPIDPSHG